MGKHHNKQALLIAVIAVVAIILIVALVGGLAVCRYEHYLSGLWVGDPAFLRKAQLRDMQLFIAPREDGCRQGYLIMTDLHGGFVANQAIEIRERSAFQRWWTALGSTFKTRADMYTARCVELDFDEGSAADGLDPPMPSRVKMTLSVLDGTLTLYDDEKVYAFLAKDQQASAVAVEAYAGDSA